MRKPLIILPFVIFLSVSCTQSELRDRSNGGGGNGSLDQSDYDRMRDINVAMNDAQQAVEVAFSGASVQDPGGRAVSEKVGKMAEALKGCRAAKAGSPEEKFDRDWRLDQIMDGANCPINFMRRMTYKISREARAWDFYYVFKVSDPEFAKLNALTDQRGGGRITFSRNRKKEDLFTGSFDYPGIQVTGIGSVNVKVYFSASHIRGVSTGSMVIQFKGPAFSYQAAYNWSLQNDTESFYLNGKPIESTEFLDMFSAFDVPGMKRRILEEIRTPR